MTGPATSPTDAASVHRIDLELGTKLGSGSQGSLYRVTSVRSPAAAGLPPQLVFKEFHPTTAVSATGLTSLARFREEADAHDREVLDAMTVWPAAVVEDGSHRACGYLMRSIPDGFFQRIETTAGSERIPREIQQLFVAEHLARKNFGETASGIERLALAREMAFVLGFLHKRDFVYGDLSYKNAVFCLRPRPAVILLDCDAVRHVGESSGVPQLHSPGWKPPEGGPQTKQTDRYKLGLFVLRAMTPGVNAQNRSPDKAVGHLDAEGLSLLRRALGKDPAVRTTGREWVAYLNGRITAAGGITGRTGAPPAPSRPTTRRAVMPSWEDARRRPPIRTSYVVTSGGVRAVAHPPAAVPPRRGLPLRTSSWAPNPSAARTTGWPPSGLSGGWALPRRVDIGLRIGVAVAVLVVAGIIGVVTNLGSAPSPTTTRRGATTTTTLDPGAGDAGLATTAFTRGAEAAVVDAKKFVDAIDQRVAGLYLPAGTYGTGDADLPWVVQFTSADPDRSSGRPVWTVRNVARRVGTGFVELPPTTVTAEHLTGPTDAWGTGLDSAVHAVAQPVFGGLRLICDPNGTACLWRFTDPTTYYSTNGAEVPDPPAWATAS